MKEPWIEVNHKALEDYKSEAVIGSVKIRFDKNFNFINRLMFRLVFGIKINKIK